MKTWKLLLLALVPGLWGWLCNWLTAVSLNGPAFLFTLAFYIQVPAAIVSGWGICAAAPKGATPPACC